MAYLTQLQLQNLRNYRYASSNSSFIDKQLASYWEFCVQLLPLWVAPNLVTFSGLLVMIADYILVAKFCFTFNETAPSWVWIVSALALWTYQTLDAIDGKQARRTGSSSPLGQLFDHGCDALTTTIVANNVTSAMNFSGPWAIILHALHIGPFFISNWEEFQTGVMRFGVLGVTEAELTHILLYLVTAVFGHDVWQIQVPFIGVQIRHLAVYALAISFTGTSAEAFTIAFYDSLKKNRSFKEGYLQLMQFVGFVSGFLLWSLSPTSLLATYPRFYMLAFGLTFGYLISMLIIYHTSHTPFLRFPIILWPLPFVVLNSWFPYLPVQEEVILAMYTSFAIVVYFHFVSSMITEITTFLNIHCFKITVRTPPPAAETTSKIVDVTNKDK